MSSIMARLSVLIDVALDLVTGLIIVQWIVDGNAEFLSINQWIIAIIVLMVDIITTYGFSTIFYRIFETYDTLTDVLGAIGIALLLTGELEIIWPMVATTQMWVTFVIIFILDVVATYGINKK